MMRRLFQECFSSFRINVSTRFVRAPALYAIPPARFRSSEYSYENRYRNANSQNGGLLRPIVGSMVFIPTCFYAAVYLEDRRRRREMLNSLQNRSQPHSNTRPAFWPDWLRSPGEMTTVHWITAANALVFAMWHIPSLRPFCRRHFLNEFRSSSFFPLIGAAFSHSAPLHFIFNMIALSSFGAGLEAVMGKEYFLAYYLSAACFSSLLSRVGWTRWLVPRSYGSLGASGALVGLLFLSAVIWPNAKAQVIFLPAVRFSLPTAVKTLACIDTLGLALGWGRIDHLAHLGGLGFGLLFWYLGREFVTRQREFLAERRGVLAREIIAGKDDGETSTTAGLSLKSSFEMICEDDEGDKSSAL